MMNLLYNLLDDDTVEHHRGQVGDAENRENREELWGLDNRLHELNE